MFKKLKQKINEEQSPQRNAQSPPQAQVNTADRRSLNPPLHQDAPASPNDRELLAGMIAEPAFLSEYTIFALDHSKRPKPPQGASASGGRAAGSPRGSVNGDGSTSPQRDEPQSLAQKLQQKVSSVESLFRGSSPSVPGLFRAASRDSLVRSASRESLTPLGETDPQAAPSYDPSSDIESEAEDAPGNADANALPKEDLLHRLQRVEKSLANYRTKYSELVIAYRTVHRDKEKTQAILSQSQDKSLRRIGELREELQMDQQAKKHLQEEFDATLEEKDQMITVLQTQVALMKKRLHGAPGLGVPVEGEAKPSEEIRETASAPQSPSRDLGAEAPSQEGSVEPGKEAEVLQQRVKRQENLLQRCKELLRTHKERSAQLASENDALQQQLQERLQELEKMKELHTTEKTKLITQLRDAKNLIEQLEQDKGMVIAETKRQMHETLEMKEEEVAQLRGRVQQAVVQKEELQEQKEKNEKSGFEELERALGVAQRAEEARRQLQVQMEECLKEVEQASDERVKEVEQASEEERKSLQQELTRVKQEVVNIMKKSSEDRIAELERTHTEALARKDEELQAQINQAVEQCREEMNQAAQESEQQASLAVEEAELQKTALQAGAENKAKELLLELETARTKILELESSLKRPSEEEGDQELSSQMEELKKKHEADLLAVEEKHQELLEKCKAEQAEALNRQHGVTMQELQEKHKAEVEAILKDSEKQFHVHIEDMNQKTLEKLDLKQTELEALSSEISEVTKSRMLLEEKLAAAEEAGKSAREQFEARLQEEQVKYQADVEGIKLRHKDSLGGVKKTLKGELNKLKMILEEKEKEAEEHQQQGKMLKEELEKAQQCRDSVLRELEELKQKQRDGLGEISEQLTQSESEVKNLKELLERAQGECKQKADLLEQKVKELQEVSCQVEQAKQEITEKENSYTDKLKAVQEDENKLRKQLDEERKAHERKIENIKKDMDGKLKSQENKAEKVRQKTKEMQEKFKKKLQDTQEALKGELAKKEKELQQKEQQLKDKILEMAQASSEGLSTAMTDLEANHKEQLEKLGEVKRQEQEQLSQTWKEKISQQEEELQEKHSLELQEKAQELEAVSEQLGTTREEKERVLKEMTNLREELAIRETTVQKLQAELRKAAAKLESLSHGEAMLKEQVESVEKRLNQALGDRNMLQDQVVKLEDESRERVRELSGNLEDVQNKLSVLEGSRKKEGVDFQKKLEEKVLELQVKEKEFQNHVQSMHAQLEKHVREVQVTIEGCADQFSTTVGNRVRELQDRVVSTQKRVTHLRNTIIAKTGRICTLEGKLKQREEENQTLRSSLEQLTLKLKENSDKFEALTNERVSLQKTSENNSQILSEKDLRIEQLTEENRMISETIKANALHVSNLEGIINDLKTQLAHSIADKEEAISVLTQQHVEEKQSLNCQMEETVETLNKEKSLALRETETLRNKLTEFKTKAESKFTDNHNTVKSLQARIQDMERQIAEKEENVQRLAASLDNQSISKSEMDQALSEKEQKVTTLTFDLQSCTRKAVDLEEQLDVRTKECEQMRRDLQQLMDVRDNEKREIMEQVQQAQVQSSQSGLLVQEMEGKLLCLEKEVQATKEQLERQRSESEKEKTEILREKEDALRMAEERSSEGTGKVAELKKKAEQKISLIRKQLTSQIEEKEKVIKSLQTQLQEAQQNQSEKEEVIKSLQAQLQEVHHNQAKKEEVIKSLQTQLQEVHHNQAEKEEVIKSLQTQLQEAQQNQAEKEEVIKSLQTHLQEVQQNQVEKEQQNQVEKEEVINSLQAQLQEAQQNQAEKEEVIKSLQTQLQEVHQNQAEKEQQMQLLGKKEEGLEEALRSLREEHEKHLEQVRHDESLTREKCLESLKSSYEETIAALQTKISQEGSCATTDNDRGEEILPSLTELQGKLEEALEQDANYQAEISRLKADLAEQTALVQELQNTRLVETEHCVAEQNHSVLGKEPVGDVPQEEVDWQSQKEALVKEYEQKLQELTQRLEEKEGLLGVYQNSPQGNGDADGDSSSEQSPEHLKSKLARAEQEKQKIQKDFTRLQKDLRALRREHEQELEHLKREMAEETEKKQKLEIEDLEMKHNSALKQILREFSTQMALKEKELEGSVRETIEKAQCVEVELMDGHREEASQLKKVIAQKDDDLKRTVQRYEEILQSREEEMGSRVWEVQKELDEIQQRSLTGPQGLEELQVQLAQKTTQLSEARLREQENHDRILSLEDKLRCTHKNSVVTRLDSSYKDAPPYNPSALNEPTEFEYLRKVMFEYMMGRETKTMAKVITSVLKFPPEEAEKILEREDSRVPWLR